MPLRLHRHVDQPFAKIRLQPLGATPTRANVVCWPTTLIVLAYGIGVLLVGSPVFAKALEHSTNLVVSSKLLLKPGIEIPLEIGVDPGKIIPTRVVIVIRGMPPGMQLSEGRAFGPGVWVLPANASLKNLKLRVPAEPKGGGVLTVSLATTEGVSISEAQITLLIASSASEEAAAEADPLPIGGYGDPVSSLDGEQQTSLVPKLTRDERAELLMLFAKGKDSLKLGNILIARRFYQRAAVRGLAEAAMALGTTYDPRELVFMKAASGVLPDSKLAKKWYERAKELGSPEAAQRLRQLPQP